MSSPGSQSAKPLVAQPRVARSWVVRPRVARLRVAQQHGVELRSNAMVVAQVWRDRHGRQVGLAQLLRAVDVRAVSPQEGRQGGVLLGATGTSDPVDATVVLLTASSRPTPRI